VTLVLKGTHPLQRNGVPEGDVRRRHVDTELDAKWTPEFELALQLALRGDVNRVAGEVVETHAGESRLRTLRLRRKARPAKNNGRRIRKLRLFALVAVLGLLSSASFVFGLMTAIASQLPEYNPAHQQKIAQDGYMYDRHGKLLAVLRGRESRVILPSAQIAPIMKQAIVAIEDKRFYDHRGVDLRAIGRAFWADVQNKSVVEGGSTITQQFIKNAYVKDNRSVARKLKEAALAWQLEQRKSKDWILTAYLNTIYFGNGAYGIEQAAMTYFHEHASDLTLPQAALLAGIPRDPAAYDPVTNPKAATERRRLVLDQMRAQGIIAPDEYRMARSAALPNPDEVHLPGTQERQGQYFINYVKDQLIHDEDYGAGRVFGGGLRVYTTFDLGLQTLARASIAKVLSNPDGPQAALVAIDPRSGAVLAMVGGSNYRESQFNLAVQGERQPGSAFKPFVLAAALDEGISPATHFESHPVVIPLGDRLWQVNNYEGDYLGDIDLETATIHSDNSVYAQLTSIVGPQNVARIARDAGISSKLNSYFAIGLGAEAANPLEMARAFSTFANGGNRIDGSILGNVPRAVTEIDSGNKKRLNSPVAHRVLSPTKTEILNSILQKVVTEGTGHRAALPDRPAAGKTGTTENYGDAWFVGYVPQLTVAVWVGYPRELKSMNTEYHGLPVAGGTFPADIWRTFMESALPYLKDEPESFPSTSTPYASPHEVVYRDGRIQIDNGNCHSPRDVLFFTDEQPRQTANCKLNEVEVPDLVGQPLPAARAHLVGQPLTPEIVYREATAGQRVNVVVGQAPKRGRLSAYDRVKLFVAKPTHGVVPQIVGLPVSLARHKLERRGLRYELEKAAKGRRGRVVFQLPRAGVAAAPGMVIRIAVAA
jgi:penicillin-binding protein 1A